METRSTARLKSIASSIALIALLLQSCSTRVIRPMSTLIIPVAGLDTAPGMTAVAFNIPVRKPAIELRLFGMRISSTPRAAHSTFRGRSAGLTILPPEPPRVPQDTVVRDWLPLNYAMPMPRSMRSADAAR